MTNQFHHQRSHCCPQIPLTYMIFRRTHRGSHYRRLTHSLPPPPPSFFRPSNISENPEWSPLWLTLPPLREMVPLPTYQMPVTVSSGANVDDSQVINDPEIAFGANVAALQPVHDPKDDAIAMSLVPVSRQESSTSQESNNAIVSSIHTQITPMSCPFSPPRNMMNDISENPSCSPLSCPAHISYLSITVTLNVRSTLVSPQEPVLAIIVKNARLP